MLDLARAPEQIEEGVIGLSVVNRAEDGPVVGAGSTGEWHAFFEQPVKCGAADSELAGGAELVSAVEMENMEDVVVDHGVQIPGLRSPNQRRIGRMGGRDSQIFGSNNAIGAFDYGGFEDAREFAEIAGPGVLEELRDRARGEDDWRQMIAR